MSVAPHSASESPSPPPHTGETPVAQGYSVDASDQAALRRAIELAFDYRGDVTIMRKSSAPPIEGYLFDRRIDRASGDMTVRLMACGSDERIAIPISDIARIAFTGRDTASGKSFETWVRKYVDKKRAGEKASIESEPLE